MAFDKMKARSDTLEGKLKELMRQQHFFAEEKGQMMRSLQQENSRHEENQKRVSTLKNRLDAIVQNSHNQYIVNNSIRELMRENDNLKWVISGKTNEIEKVMEVNQQLKAKVIHLTKKLDNLTQRKLDAKKEMVEFFSEKQPFHLLAKSEEIPPSLDFRQIFLRPEFSNMLADIVLYGAGAFSNQIMNNGDNIYHKKSAIEFVASQYVNFKEFGDSLNNLLLEIINLMQIDNLPEMMKDFSQNFKGILKGNDVFLWIEDEMTGVLYTYDSQGLEKRALKDTGLFKELFEKKRTISMNFNY